VIVYQFISKLSYKLNKRASLQETPVLDCVMDAND